MNRGGVKFTWLEEEVREALDKKGVKYIHHYPLRGGWIGDFAVSHTRIIIETDGKRWHSSKKQKKRDRFKDHQLKRMGWEVVRIREDEIKKESILKLFLLYSRV